MKSILQKYDNKIVINNVSLPISDYTKLLVSKIEELVKLAVNLSKHIDCYQDDKYAEFAVIIDERVYYYQVNH